MLTAPVKIATAVALAGFLVSYPALAQAPSASRETIDPTGVAPGSLPYSPGIRAGNIVYVSGQVAGEAGPDFREQTVAVIKKVQAIVEAAGTTMASVDKCVVFLTRQSDFVVMNEVWRGAFATNPPARSTVIVAALSRPEFLIELECTAHK
jgi:2-iminobutanoate/2-iminopropanoate deaminase